MKAIAVSRDLLSVYGLRNGTKVRIAGLPGFYRVRDKMNKRYKKRDSCTDVLAFPLDRAVHAHGRRVIVGEIVISLDQTHSNAKRFGNTFTEELLLYVIHGVLHILGYDDRAAADRRVMERKQKDFFTKCVKRKRCI